MSIFPHLLILFFVVFPAARFTLAAEPAVETLLPVPACSEGWVLDGKVTRFDKDSLFDRINGESELYFPYGFEALGYARYENKQNPKIAIDVDVYKLGSLIDAFGIFANYRRKEDADLVIGAQGTISPSQVFFYQDRYFVRLQVTGAISAPQDVLRSCARAVSQNLPKTSSKPKELEAFTIPSMVARSERYIAESLLGYDFFPKGLIADAVLNSGVVQVFVVLAQSRDDARKAFDRYSSYLKTAEHRSRAGEAAPVSLEAVDPMYGQVRVELVGRFIVGVLRFQDSYAAKQLVEQIRSKIVEK